MAVRERSHGAKGKDPVAQGLGWFSIALGTAQIAAPRELARFVGVEDGLEQRAVMRAIGVREIAQGVGILSRPRPVGWLWSRVLGDAIDLALLARAESRKRKRVAAAMAAVAGVAVPDLVESAKLTRGEAGGEVRARKSITVNRAIEAVYGFWHDFENFPRFMTHVQSVRVTGSGRSHWKVAGPLGRSVEWDAEIVVDRPDELISWRSLPGATVENSGFVRFKQAPGGRGVEVTVEVRYAPPAGPLGVAAAKLLGEEPATQLSDDLRRFKQVIETGEVVRSDATVRGHAVGAHLKQRPAQPIGGPR